MRSLLRGMAALVSWGQLQSLDIPQRTDAEAIASDWDAVGDDMWAVMGCVMDDTDVEGRIRQCEQALSMTRQEFIDACNEGNEPDTFEAMVLKALLPNA